MANEYLKVQKLANSSAKAIQKMVNKANEKALKFNADEAKKAREFNAKEASTARTFNANESAIARTFNASEAQKARDWQTEMSNTAHQREVEDLKKAGLNPVLSAGAGATSYTTSSASASPASAVGASANNASGSVESGAGAISSIMSGMLGAMTGLEQTRMQTDATLRASQISASASRYVADQNLRAAKYTADKGYQKEMDKPQGSPFALIDKYFGKSNGNVTASTGEYLKSANKLSPTKKSDGYKLTASDKRHIDIGLNKLNIPINAKLDGKSVSRNVQRKLYVDAFKFGDQKSMKMIYNLQKQNGHNPYKDDYYVNLAQNYQ